MASILILQYAIPVLLPLLIFLFFLLKNKLSFSTKKDDKNLPPSPPKLPILGNLHQLTMSPHQGLRSLSQKYGDLMLLHLGSKPVIVASSAETACMVIKTHDLIFCSRPQWKFSLRFLNNGKDVIMAPYGDYWRNMRSICVNQLLSKKRVDSFRKIREEEVNLMVDKIKGMILSSTASSADVEMRSVFTSLMTDLISRAVLGRKLNDNPDEAGYDIDVNKLVERVSDLAPSFAIGEFVPCLAWIDWVAGATAGVDKAAKTLDEFLEKVLADRSFDVGKQKGDEGLQGCTAKDFVDILLDLNKSGDTNGYVPLDNESVKGLLMDMFLGGIETSSTALEWMMSEILRSPRVTEKLQEEAAKFAKGKDVIKEEDLKNMVYLKATIKETLRLHPPVPLLVPRETMRDAKINGYDIVAGSMVFVNAWAIGRDPRHWEEPDQFRPERFLNPSSKIHTHEFNMVPFGSGRRGCPGELFGTTIMELAMANLLLQFIWRLPFGIDRETFDMRERPGAALHKFIPLLAVARSSKSKPDLANYFDT